MIYEFHGCIKIETCIQKRGEDGSSKFKFYNNFADTFSFCFLFFLHEKDRFSSLKHLRDSINAADVF